MSANDPSSIDEQTLIDETPYKESDYIEDPPPPKRKGKAFFWVMFLLILAALGASAFFVKGLLELEQSRTTEAKREAEEAKGKARELAVKTTELEQKVQALEAEKVALATERETLTGQVKQKESELLALQATYTGLQSKMEEEIKKGEIRLSESGGKISVDMVDKILFASGEAKLSPRGEEVLSRIGEVLAKVNDRLIQVSGHTDDSPISGPLKATFPSNWELSAARAVNVVRHLGEKAKVPSKRMIAAGYGEFHPVASNITGEGRARNRRIEILLTPLLDAKPSVADLNFDKPAPAKAKAAKATKATAKSKATAKKKSSTTRRGR